MKRLLALMWIVVLLLAVRSVRAEDAAATPEQAPAQMAPVTVTAEGEYYTDHSTSGTKTDSPIMETAGSAQVINQNVIADQRDLTLIESLGNVSGVQPSSYGFNYPDAYSIRGFDTGLWTRVDGFMQDENEFSGLNFDMGNISRIEVNKGPSSSLYGQNQPGGLVNIVTKDPSASPAYSVEHSFGSFALSRTTFDATGPLDGAKTLLYRLNVTEENNGSFRDFIHQDDLYVHPDLQWNPDPQNKVTLKLSYITGTAVQDFGIPFDSTGNPANVPLNRNYAEPQANQNQDWEYEAKALASHKFSDTIRVETGYRFHYVNNNEPVAQFYGGNADPSGNLSTLYITGQGFEHTSHEAYVNLIADFEIEGMKNTFLLGGDYLNEHGGWILNQTGFINVPPPINIYSPTYSWPFPADDPANYLAAHQVQDEWGLNLQDQMTLFKNLHLMAGLGLYANTSNETYSPDFTGDPLVDHPPVTPRFGLLWQAIPEMSLYGTYTTNYGGSQSGLYADGKPVPPLTAEQWEFGVKTEFGKKFSWTASVYQIVQNNVATADPANPAFLITIGQERSRGFETDLTGEVAKGLKLTGNYSFMDPVVTEDANTPSLQGLQMAGTSRNSGSFWATYEFQEGKLEGFKLGAGVVAKDGQVAYEYGTNAPDSIPAYAVLNAMAAYGWRVNGTKMSAQLNFNNVLDRAYFINVAPSQAWPGEPFNVRGSLKVEL